MDKPGSCNCKTSLFSFFARNHARNHDWTSCLARHFAWATKRAQTFYMSRYLSVQMDPKGKIFVLQTLLSWPGPNGKDDELKVEVNYQKEETKSKVYDELYVAIVD